MIALLTLRRKPMLWLFSRLFGNQYDWVASAKKKIQCCDYFWSCSEYNVIGLLSLRWKLMLWLVSKLFGNYCDWVAFAKAKANVAIVSEVIRKPMWLDCFRWGENQCYGVFEICSKTKCVLVAFANVKANVMLLP